MYIYIYIYIYIYREREREGSLNSGAATRKTEREGKPLNKPAEGGGGGIQGRVAAPLNPMWPRGGGQGGG
jgi:hypothetical protein